MSCHVDSLDLLLHVQQVSEAVQSPVQQREGDKGLHNTDRGG